MSLFNVLAIGLGPIVIIAAHLNIFIGVFLLGMQISFLIGAFIKDY